MQCTRCKKHLDQKNEQVKAAHMKQSDTIRIASNALEVHTLQTSTGPVSGKYAPLVRLLLGKVYYDAVCLNEIAPKD